MFYIHCYPPYFCCKDTTFFLYSKYFFLFFDFFVFSDSKNINEE